MPDNIEEEGAGYMSASKSEDGGEANPRDMLKLYRQHLHPFDVVQIAKFKDMNPADRQELLFMMNLHTNKVVQYLHKKIDEKEAATVAMPKPNTEH